jgi:hypothetical protein
MHKSATKCNEIVGKWCKNKHGASKIIDTLETYQRPSKTPSSSTSEAPPCSSQTTDQGPPSSGNSGRGFMPYFNAGANAGSGRDASDPPLQDYAM